MSFDIQLQNILGCWMSIDIQQKKHLIGWMLDVNRHPASCKHQINSVPCSGTFHRDLGGCCWYGGTNIHFFPFQSTCRESQGWIRGVRSEGE
jgi:hypothetical protein